MNYYRHFAAQTLGEGLRNPLLYLVSALFAIIAVLLLRSLADASLPSEKLELLRMTLVINGLAFMGYMGIFLFAHSVFFNEKKAKTLVMTLCSPASLTEIFWGKVLGVAAAGFAAPALFALAASAALAPRGLAELASWETAAALVIVLAAEIAYAAVNGMFMLTARDERGIALVLYCFGGAQVMLAAMTGTAAGQALFKGVLFQYSAITAVVCLLTAAAYFLWFSKIRVVESA